MLAQLSQNWWLIALRGVAALIFGILAFVWPGMTFLSLIIVFGAYAVVDGIFAIIAAFTNRAQHDRWWVMLLGGIVSIIAGLIAFFEPGLAAFALLLTIAAWAIITGVIEVIAAIRLRAEIKGEWLLALSGILSVVFGVLLFLDPATGSVVIIWIIGGYAIAAGIILLALAWRVRGLAGTTATSGMKAAT